MRVRKSLLLLLIIFIVFFLIRLPFLSSTYILNDERDIILTGYSIAKTGKDLYGNFLPFRFENISPSNPIFAIYYSALWHIFFPKTIFFSRLAYVFISSFLVFFIYLIVLKITENKKISILTLAIFCFNPWIFHVTHFALDIPLTLTFVLFGIYLYLNKRMLTSLFLFFLSSFTYQGFKFLIPFLLFYLELFFLIKNQTDKQSFLRRNLINLIFIFVLIIATLIIDKNTALMRKKELIFFNTERLKKIVDFKRGSSKADLSISKFFDNKMTVIIDHLTSNVLKNYDFFYLFKRGEQNAINGNVSAGQFFEIFVIFYLLGFFYLGKYGKKEDFYLFGLTFIGVIPAIIKADDEPSFSIRGSLAAVGFSYLLSLGLIYYLDFIKNKKYRRLFNFFIITLLFFNIAYFFYNYYFRRPILVSELFNENQRKLLDFLKNNHQENIKIFHPFPKDIYLSLLFLEGRKEDLIMVQKNLKKGLPYYWNNTYELNICKNKYNYFKEKNVIVFEGCLSKEDYDRYEQNHKLLKVPYSDFYSGKTAYFLFLNTKN